MMDRLTFTIGFSPTAISTRHMMQAVQQNLKGISGLAGYVYDLHFPHYNPQICASGRPMRGDLSLDQVRQITFDTIEWNAAHTGFKLTLLLNYLLHDNYKVVVDNFVDEFHARGINSVVVADLELIKRLKDRLPDLEIQGSCLSHRMTCEELEQERKEGVVLHNPSVNIIRNPEQLKKNARAGYAQKVIVFEGCLNHCPDENSTYGHRWFLGRSLTQDSSFCTKTRIARDPRHFFKANWVTARRFRQLMPYMAVAKLPRCRSAIDFGLSRLIRAVEQDEPYNVVDFIGAGYQTFLARDVGDIPSDLFDDTFFDTVQSCKMDCRERGCFLCFEMMDRIKRLSYKQKRLARRAGHQRHHQWYVDEYWARRKNIV
jgi:hypothetical protein